MLEAQGFDVVAEACDGYTAIAAAERLRPDLALVDIGLPGVDGFEVAERLRRAGSVACIVLTSGRARADFGGRVENSVADGFIGKDDLSGDRLHALLGA